MARQFHFMNVHINLDTQKKTLQNMFYQHKQKFSTESPSYFFRSVYAVFHDQLDHLNGDELLVACERIVTYLHHLNLIYIIGAPNDGQLHAALAPAFAHLVPLYRTGGFHPSYDFDRMLGKTSLGEVIGGPKTMSDGLLDEYQAYLDSGLAGDGYLRDPNNILLDTYYRAKLFFLFSVGSYLPKQEEDFAHVQEEADFVTFDAMDAWFEQQQQQQQQQALANEGQ